MQVLHTETYLRKVEPRHILLHFLDLPKVKKKLPTTAEVRHKNKIRLSLKNILELQQERILDFDHYISFVFHDSFLLVLYNKGFIKDFHRIHLIRVDILDQIHPREPSNSRKIKKI